MTKLTMPEQLALMSMTKRIVRVIDNYAAICCCSKGWARSTPSGGYEATPAGQRRLDRALRKRTAAELSRYRGRRAR